MCVCMCVCVCVYVCVCERVSMRYDRDGDVFKRVDSLNVVD